MLQSTNQRRLLPPGNPGTTCPLRLFQTFLPSPLLSPPSPASGRTRRTSFSFPPPSLFLFSPCFPFLFSFCGFYFSPLQVMLWVSGIPAAQRVGKLWKVGIFPSQKADGSCPLCPAGVGVRSGGSGSVPGAVTEQSRLLRAGWPRSGLAMSRGCPAEEGSGLAAPLVPCSVPMRSGHPFAPRGHRCPGQLSGSQGAAGAPRAVGETEIRPLLLPLRVLGLGPAGGVSRCGMVLKVTAEGGLGDFGTGVLPSLLANPGLEVGENPLS